MKFVPAELQEWERKNTCKKNWRDFHAGLNLKQEGFLVLFCFYNGFSASSFYVKPRESNPSRKMKKQHLIEGNSREDFFVCLSICIINPVVT